MTTEAPAVTPGASVRGHSHGTPDQPVDARNAVVRSHDVADFPAITGREEEWRFTPLGRVRGLAKAAPGAAPEGQLAATVTWGELPAGVEVTSVARGAAALGQVLTPFDRVSALAYGEFSHATVVSVARDAAPGRPVVLSITGTGAAGPGFGHTLVEVGESAEVTVVLDHTGSAVLADNVELSVGANARLTLVSIADWSGDSVQLQHQKARLGRDSRLTHVAVSLGGDLVRQHTSFEFTDRGGEVDAYGIYFADAGQHLEHRLFADHAVPDCRSNVVYRGALQGRDAHTVWVGDVLIRATATGTDTYEINRNLILTDGARADSIPNLEIETGEVAGAGHASATGRFDDEQLFYLQSRGISAEEARRLVVRGFFAELLAKIGVPEVTDRLSASIEARLSKAGA
ncbi:MAG: Fe-S cluster assembly protein SufD [Cryptosporangiaceae bacterium]|nr:Fe-S cluster assembly protein SufD [Cryptosporangiaceae bacterium]